MAKALKVKVRKFLGLICTFVEVTGEDSRIYGLKEDTFRCIVESDALSVERLQYAEH